MTIRKPFLDVLVLAAVVALILVSSSLRPSPEKPALPATPPNLNIKAEEKEVGRMMPIS